MYLVFISLLKLLNWCLEERMLGSIHTRGCRFHFKTFVLSITTILGKQIACLISFRKENCDGQLSRSWLLFELFLPTAFIPGKSMNKLLHPSGQRYHYLKYINLQDQVPKFPRNSEGHLKSPFSASKVMVHLWLKCCLHVPLWTAFAIIFKCKIASCVDCEIQMPSFWRPNLIIERNDCRC